MTLDERAAQLDAADPLAPLRERFVLPSDRVYLDGNSLGAMPRAVPGAVQCLLEREWAAELIASWNTNDWIRLPQHVGERIAALVGAAPGQVLSVDSISVNLFKLLAAALSLRPGRGVILLAESDFPTDGYVAQGLASLLGEQRCTIRRLPAEQLATGIDDDVAVLLLTEVNYRTGERYDMAALTRAAHAAGALALWDLAHSAGAMPVHLDDCEVDLAVGCGYKFLNGGPGAPGFVYVAARHQDGLAQPISGWLGHRAPFDFDPDYRPAPGILRLQGGTPPVVSMVALRAALSAFDDVDLALVREKSLALGDFFLEGAQTLRDEWGIGCVTPRDHARRGSQVSLRHDEAWGLSQALIERGVIVDFRAPDILRLGFAPLYNGFADVARAIAVLRDVLASGAHLDPRFAERPVVT
jgi:kynureninase